MLLQRNNHILEVIESDVSITSLLEGDIIHIHFKENSEINSKDIDQLMKLYNHWLKDEKKYFLISSGLYSSVTKEAREFCDFIEKGNNAAGIAVFTENLSFRLLANFYNTFYKPKSPYKVFDNKEKALNWLTSLKSVRSQKTPVYS